MPGRGLLCFHLAEGHLFSVPALLLMLDTQHSKGISIEGNLSLVCVYHRSSLTEDTSTRTEVWRHSEQTLGFKDTSCYLMSEKGVVSDITAKENERGIRITAILKCLSRRP